ncbi:TRAP transporter small permease [Pararhodospirillum oryzae]|uniref:TRAP transporter small permease protein n=1 Tax=Pararhodospirillum oryzae TaxID=478448 RepID=A0A512H4N9_9PROT|nr:TRAP transporter small permease [Pararhodospirillum oryzae]GEO80388.1 hypothetical protein ROR02_05190 [Pararhodospirillum oryzae]
MIKKSLLILFGLALAATLGATTTGILPARGPERLVFYYVTLATGLAAAMVVAPAWFQKAEEAVISLCLAGSTTLVVIEVVLRYGFNYGLGWTEEMTLLTMGWMVLFGMSYGIKVGSHIGVDALVRLLPREGRRTVTLAAVVLCLFYAVLFLMGAWEYVVKVHRIGIEMKDIPVPKWVVFSVLVAGFMMLFMRFVDLLIALLQRRVDGFSLADEAHDALSLVRDDSAPASREARP